MMTSEENKFITQSIGVRVLPGFLTTIFLVFALTGNCAVCGLDKDYVDKALSEGTSE